MGVRGGPRRAAPARGAAARAVRAAELADRPAGQLSRRRAAAAAHRDRARAPAAGRAARRADRGRRHADPRGDPRRRAGRWRPTAPRSSTPRTTCPRSRRWTRASRCSRPGGSSRPGPSPSWSRGTRRACSRSSTPTGASSARPGASLHGLEPDVDPRRGHPAVAGGGVPGADRAAERGVSIVRTELRLLRHDPVPAAVLVGMPLVLMTLLSDAMQSTLATEGYPGVAGLRADRAGHGLRVRLLRDRRRRLRDLPRARLAHVAAAARGGAERPHAAGRQAGGAGGAGRRPARRALRLRRRVPRPHRGGLLARGRA